MRFHSLSDLIPIPEITPTGGRGEPGHAPAPGQGDARQERLLDAGLAETFPASDPVAVMRLA